MLAFLVVFVPLFFVTVLAVGIGQIYTESRQKQQVRQMFHEKKRTSVKVEAELLRPEVSQDPISRLLNRFGIFAALELLIQQAGKDWTSGKVLITSTFCCLAGIAIGLVLPFAVTNNTASAVAGLLGLCLPTLILLRARKKRIAAFEELFPEALDFISRSMRAGHGFSIGLEMLVADSSEPLRSCFTRVLHDLHLGSSLEVALDKLVLLVPIIDVRFFVSAVLLQQETGGNLSEILNNMAAIIRERFRLKGQVKAHAAHGKITGLVLAVMPVIVAVLLFFISPDYLLLLVNDPTGKMLLIGAVCGQIIGFFVIRKIVNIKV